MSSRRRSTDHPMRRSTDAVNQRSADKLNRSNTGRHTFTPTLELAPGKTVTQDVVRPFISEWVNASYYLMEVDQELDNIQDKLTSPDFLSGVDEANHEQLREFVSSSIKKVMELLSDIEMQFDFTLEDKGGSNYLANVNVSNIAEVLKSIQPLLRSLDELFYLLNFIQQKNLNTKNAASKITKFRKRIEQIGVHLSDAGFEDFEPPKGFRLTAKEVSFFDERKTVSKKIKEKEVSIKKREVDVDKANRSIAQFLNVFKGGEMRQFSKDPHLAEALDQMGDEPFVLNSIRSILNGKIKFTFKTKKKGNFIERRNTSGRREANPRLTAREREKQVSRGRIILLLLVGGFALATPLWMEIARRSGYRVGARHSSADNSRYGSVNHINTSYEDNSDNFTIHTAKEPAYADEECAPYNPFSTYGIYRFDETKDLKWEGIKRMIRGSDFFRKYFFKSSKEMSQFLENNRFDDFETFQNYVVEQFDASRPQDKLQEIFELDHFKIIKLENGKLQIMINPDIAQALNSRFGDVDAHIHTYVHYLNGSSKKDCYSKKPHITLSEDAYCFTIVTVNFRIQVSDIMYFAYGVDSSFQENSDLKSPILCNEARVCEALAGEY